MVGYQICVGCVLDRYRYDYFSDYNNINPFVLLIEKKKTRSESVDCTPPDYIMPNNKDRPLLPLHPTSKDLKGPQCIKVNKHTLYFIQII